ncbi:MAG: pyrroline-5-carboxylate reductase [Ferrovibrio sp.]|uniref:pyrroline-5-carboxylate reductase n=1 Tax=Ferrovibrio sp. TaxID=1917215 RepID=UPI00261F9AC7|nr:pyrroline-5-carboxylate reductase [Ferrovibrio sp.]MCW0236642.1 pyrroline-5-carboxylate reductase [Ferrovibrio sp.]
MNGILLVGCGKMGGAMLVGWLQRGVAAADVVVVEPNPVPGLPAGVRQVTDATAVPADFKPALVLLAVKPQVMDTVAPAYAAYAGSGACFLSVAAGKTIATLNGSLGGSAAVVRSIPNTPAAVGEGITIACANPAVSATQRKFCESLLSAVGEVGWVEDEGLIDAVTAVSGSGPAYVFWLTECMAAAGAAAGLPADLAARLARATVIGSGALMKQSVDSPEQLRKNVTSPNGTTQAALDVLMAGDGLGPLMQRAIAAATKRSRELAG